MSVFSIAVKYFTTSELSVFARLPGLDEDVLCVQGKSVPLSRTGSVRAKVPLHSKLAGPSKIPSVQAVVGSAAFSRMVSVGS